MTVVIDIIRIDVFIRIPATAAGPLEDAQAGSWESPQTLKKKKMRQIIGQNSREIFLRFGPEN